MDQLLVKLLEYLGNAEVFIKEEIPDVLQQMIFYDYYFYLLTFFACFFVSAFCFLFILSDIKLEMKKKYSDLSASLLIFFMVAMPTLVGMCCAFTSMIKISVAPKYYLIERVTSLVRHK
jgi:hypothetical protein